MTYMTKAPHWALVGAVMMLSFAVHAGAQVPKSGKASYYNSGHWQVIAYQTGEKSLGSAGEWWSVLTPKGDGKFLAFTSNLCVFAEHYLDTEKGVNIHHEVCQVTDGDGDAIFTSAHCKFNSWTDWCNGTIDGGTGKYAGITGTMRYGYGADAPFIERKSPLGQQATKSRFISDGEVALNYDLTWKMP